MQALYLLALEPIAECTADRNSYGFRFKRSVADAIEQCWLALSKNGSAQWIFEGDIKGCFDNISHDWLIANAPIDKAVLRKWLKAGFMESIALWPTEAGTPQGGIISPTLANVALDGLEAELHRRFRQPAKVNFVRYADDFIVTGCSKELLETEVKPLVANFLRVRGLGLSEEKTRITHIEQGFDFLGHNIRKYRKGKVLTKPSRQGVISLLRRARALIKANKAATQADLIATVNPLLRGWANFYRTPSPSKSLEEWTTRSGRRYGDGRCGDTRRNVSAGFAGDTSPCTRATRGGSVPNPTERRASDASCSN
jgi:RNA-directed DNA polymerase